MAFSKAWSGDSAKKIEMKTLNERSFTVELERDVKALDILAGLQNNLGHLQVDTLQESGMPGKWPIIITKTREDATKLIQQEHINCLSVFCKVCTISFERPVNYLCDAWHVFPLKYEAWTHFNN